MTLLTFFLPLLLHFSDNQLIFLHKPPTSPLQISQLIQTESGIIAIISFTLSVAFTSFQAGSVQLCKFYDYTLPKTHSYASEIEGDERTRGEKVIRELHTTRWRCLYSTLLQVIVHNTQSRNLLSSIHRLHAPPSEHFIYPVFLMIPASRGIRFLLYYCAHLLLYLLLPLLILPPLHHTTCTSFVEQHPSFTR